MPFHFLIVAMAYSMGYFIGSFFNPQTQKEASESKMEILMRHNLDLMQLVDQLQDKQRKRNISLLLLLAENIKLKMELALQQEKIQDLQEFLHWQFAQDELIALSSILKDRNLTPPEEKFLTLLGKKERDELTNEEDRWLFEYLQNKYEKEMTSKLLELLVASHKKAALQLDKKQEKLLQLERQLVSLSKRDKHQSLTEEERVFQKSVLEEQEQLEQQCQDLEQLLGSHRMVLALMGKLELDLNQGLGLDSRTAKVYNMLMKLMRLQNLTISEQQYLMTYSQRYLPEAKRYLAQKYEIEVV